MNKNKKGQADFLLILFIIIVFSLIGFSVLEAVSIKFKDEDKVIVTNGFYEGKEGIVKNTKFFFMTRDYYVCFPGDIYDCEFIWGGKLELKED